jgi:hypothetical protein
MALTVTSKVGNSSQDVPSPAKTQFTNKVAGKADGNRAKPTVKRGSDTDARWVKMLAYGHSGTGKTLAVAGFLEAGMKVLVLSTDMGGNGLASVYNFLASKGRQDLLDSNLVSIDFPDYDSLSDFLRAPTETFPDIWDFDPDMMVWDGFTGFQLLHVQEKISDISPMTKNTSEGREEGLWMEQQDWGMIKNATLRSLGNFLKLHNWKTGKTIHKYLTCLEQKPSPDKLTNEVQRAPYLQGAAASLMGPAFDIILETRTRAGNAEKDRIFEYCCVGHEKLLAKSRGYDLAPVEPANMKDLWEKKIAPKLKGTKHE